MTAILITAVYVLIAIIVGVCLGRSIECRHWESHANKPDLVPTRTANYQVYEVCPIGAGRNVEAGLKFMPPPVTAVLPIRFESLVCGPYHRLRIGFTALSGRRYFTEGTLDARTDLPSEIPARLIEMANMVEQLVHEDEMSQLAPKGG
jgi:hypothetical protein